MSQASNIQALELDAPASLEEVVRSFPTMLEKLGHSYRQLEARAQRVEQELCRANTELERKVHELDVLKSHLEAVLESLPCGVVVRDGAGRLVQANGAAVSILESSRAELLGQSSHPVLDGMRPDGEIRPHTLPSGRTAMLAAFSSEVRLADGSVKGCVEIIDDRTDECDLAQRLHTADKMAALGTLAAGVAHEIRNPLTAVKGFASLLLDRFRDDETATRWSHLIAAGVEEADEIIENLLSFGSPEKLRANRIAPDALVAEVRSMLWSGGPPSELVLREEVDAPSFRGDTIKLRHALRNLLANSIEAIRGKGEIHIGIHTEGDDLVLFVRDSGPGIPDGDRHQVLDPFFTTRPEGTGLGLALVSTIARLHGGTVEVVPHSQLGGAEIRIRIPFRPVQPEPQSPKTQAV